MLSAFFERLKVRNEINQQLATTIEDVVEIADPTIRRAGRYQKKLREPVEVAQEFCHSLIASIPGPFSLSTSSYFSEPTIKALFASPEELEELLQNSMEIQSLRKQGYGGEAVALLTMNYSEKTTFMRQQEGDIIVGDIARKTVNFTDHRLIAPSINLDVSTDGIVRRGVEVLATAAMEQITKQRNTINELRQKRDYLLGAIKILRGRKRIETRFSIPDPAKDEELSKTKALLADIELELQEALARLSYPEDSLQYLIGVIGAPASLLSAGTFSLMLDWKNVIIDDQEEEGNEISMTEFSLMDEIKRYGVFVKFTV